MVPSDSGCPAQPAGGHCLSSPDGRLPTLSAGNTNVSLYWPFSAPQVPCEAEGVQLRGSPAIYLLNAVSVMAFSSAVFQWDLPAAYVNSYEAYGG